MDCDPKTLLDLGRCYNKCIPKGMRKAIQTWLLCQWAKKKANVPFSWNDPSILGFWIDAFHPGPGGATGDLPTFLATADFPSVTVLDLTVGNILVGITGLQNLPALQRLVLNNNSLTTVDVSGLTALTYLDCSSQPTLTSLNVSGCTSLVTLLLGSCNLSSVNVSGFTHLVTLICVNNGPLSSLTLTGCTSLTTLDCNTCNLSSLNCSGLVALTSLNCNSNNLGTLNITGDFAITTLDFSSNPSVTIIGP